MEVVLIGDILKEGYGEALLNLLALNVAWFENLDGSVGVLLGSFLLMFGFFKLIICRRLHTLLLKYIISINNN